MQKTELVLNKEGKVYHLNLKPGDVADTIILVGDPGRAGVIATYFDKIRFEGHNREIYTYTGVYKGKEISVVSTGMGTDNIEIVLTELDAMFNIDFETKQPKEKLTSLNFIRIGTSGALHADIPVFDSYLVSEYGLGLDGLVYFYEKGPFVMEREMTSSFINQLEWDRDLPKPYAIRGSSELIATLGAGLKKGITLTAPGFYAPQGREVRLNVTDKTIIDRASKFRYNGFQVTNFEMETSALYALSAMLGHQAMTVCDIIANRITGDFSPDYKASMGKLIQLMLDRISKI
ncbi:MAG: nucleoside phosphorylase [Bacteroidales bacterium]|jgi:uridine phosphorylase|nr:nucleoside phosphorylase [Bacteroidales bacterium]